MSVEVRFELGTQIQRSIVLAGTTQPSTVLGSDEEVRAKLATHAGSVECGVLPPVTRWIGRSRRSIIFERPPFLADIVYYGVRQADVSTAKAQEFTLPIPWTVYGICLNANGYPSIIYVFATKGSLSSDTDLLHPMPLVNCEVDGHYCVPTPASGPNDLSLSDACSFAYELIWGSNFNMDIVSTVQSAYASRRPAGLFTDVGPAARVSPASLYKRWSKKTLEEVVTWDDWSPSPMMLGDFMQRLSNFEQTNYTRNVAVNRLRML